MKKDLPSGSESGADEVTARDAEVATVVMSGLSYVSRDWDDDGLVAVHPRIRKHTKFM